jgi:hypothetical protein
MLEQWKKIARRSRRFSQTKKNKIRFRSKIISEIHNFLKHKYSK